MRQRPANSPDGAQDNSRARRKVWMFAALPILIPTLTAISIAAGLPLWATPAVVLAQAALVWLMLRDAHGGDRPGRGGVGAGAGGYPQAVQRDRAALRAHLRACEPGQTSGAALALRLDEADRLRAQLGPDAFAALTGSLGERLAQALREQDLFCPLGDDGFGVALRAHKGLELGSVLVIAQRLQSRLAAPLPIDGRRIWPSVSIGFSLSPRAAMLNGLDMLQAAERAAEKAVRGGPAGLSSYSVVDFPASVTGDTIDELRQALETGEIRPFFQPQIRADTGEVSGLEALARWQHPSKGLIPPAEFLPQIEVAGLSPRLAEHMLRRSLDGLRRLEAQGFFIPKVSVNLSTEELRNPRLADEIGWELDRQDIAPERLTLEILETVVARSEGDAAVRTIARLALMGCGIDLDDFGTGHASIANIRRFAVSRIKIDRSFVTNLDTDAEQRRLVEAILSMAGPLGLRTVAEGVETAEQQALLAQMGCDHLQGFGIGRPMPLEDLPGWLRTHAAALSTRLGPDADSDEGQAAATPGTRRHANPLAESRATPSQPASRRTAAE